MIKIKCYTCEEEFDLPDEIATNLSNDELEEILCGECTEKLLKMFD